MKSLYLLKGGESSFTRDRQRTHKKQSEKLSNAREKISLKRAVADADCVANAPEDSLTSAERSLIIWGFDLLGS